MVLRLKRTLALAEKDLRKQFDAVMVTAYDRGGRKWPQILKITLLGDFCVKYCHLEVVNLPLVQVKTDAA